MPAETTRVVQLSRRKGAKHPAGMVKVDRSGPWGNPFRVGRTYTIRQGDNPPTVTLWVWSGPTRDASPSRTGAWTGLP